MRAVPKRKASADAVHASLMPSACTLEEVATHNRSDPYWDKLWAPGSTANWVSGSMERTRVDIDPSRTNKRLMMERAEALRLLNINQGRAARLAGWSCLDSWRTLSAEQMAAMTGSLSYLDPRCSSVAASFSLDLTDIGKFPMATHRDVGLGRRVLYRPGTSNAFDDLIKPTLTWPEWVSVTGGYPWSHGGQYDRHNLLATEIALRAAEYLPVGAVLGEKFATVDLLAGSGLGKTVKKPDQRRADGIIIRPDGLRIAYELTATASASFESKVRRWAQILADRPLETSGLVIVFVAASHPERLSSGNDPRPEIYRRIAKVLKDFPGTGADSPAARIGVASWDEWFPARHELGEAFFSLEADFATTQGKGAQRWAPRQLFGDYAFTPWETFDATAVVDNAPVILATPHWMRTGDHTHLIGTPMSRAGEATPHPAPAKPGKVKGRPLGAGVGVAGDARLPVRLRLSS
ncbi:hypothetical protein [Arthrobacter sp. H20]|uniref:hypothetical protein n=1 Tax=Arthrobacter sp. H20 TaxID=1267981 RepID=UPI000479FF82|nr:hypothetical protein [Arthrobacter sp. H20]